jgi:hypothetical protein
MTNETPVAKSMKRLLEKVIEIIQSMAGLPLPPQHAQSICVLYLTDPFGKPRRNHCELLFKQLPKNPHELPRAFPESVPGPFPEQFPAHDLLLCPCRNDVQQWLSLPPPQ